MKYSTNCEYIDTTKVDLTNCRRLPARLLIAQVAFLLNFQLYEIVILVRLGLLRPLGNPWRNARKYFAGVDIESLSKNRDWLDKASGAIAKVTRDKNKKARNRAPKAPHI